MLLFTCFILLTSTICCAATPKSEHAVTLDNLLIVQSVDVGGQAGSGCSWFDPLDLCDIGEKAVQKLLDALPGITNEIKDAVMEVVFSHINVPEMDLARNCQIHFFQNEYA